MGKGSASEMKQQTDRPALSAECKAAMERVRRENEAFLAANGRAPRGSTQPRVLCFYSFEEKR